MFNLQGSEIIFILLIALVVLGPEKLPGAVRRVTSLYTELRKMSTGFQDEFKNAIDAPLREMKSTADLVKNAADPKRIAEEAEREAELKASAEKEAKKAKQARDTTAAMEAAGQQHSAEASELPPPAAGPTPSNAPAEPIAAPAEPVDAFADPVDEAPVVDVADVAPDAVVVDVNAWDPPDAAAFEANGGAPAPATLDAPPIAGTSSADVDLEPEDRSA